MTVEQQKWLEERGFKYECYDRYHHCYRKYDGMPRNRFLEVSSDFAEIYYGFFHSMQGSMLEDYRPMPKKYLFIQKQFEKLKEKSK